jgi:CRP-like cAMP-binding protein
VLCRGWGYRFLVPSNGRRQILGFLLPGDLFSAASMFEGRFGFSVDALTEVDITGFRRTEVRKQLAANPGLWTRWAESVERQAGVADELLVALGRRTAEERIAYLILHLTRRMRVLAMAGDDRYRFPLKQTHIADALGLTSECVCRALSGFRKRGILAISGGYLEILDAAELERMGSPTADRRAQRPGAALALTT